MPKGYILTTDEGLIQNGISLLATITGIDLKTVGQTTLYTVPAGKTLVITEIHLIPTTVVGFAVAATIRIGKTPLFAEWLPLTTLTGLISTALAFYLAMAGVSVKGIFAAGEVVALDVQTGATSTTFLATAKVYGYLY